MRRAGFGASRGELETLATRPYDDVVDDMLHPERLPTSIPTSATATTAGTTTTAPP